MRGFEFSYNGYVVAGYAQVDLTGKLIASTIYWSNPSRELFKKLNLPFIDGLCVIMNSSNLFNEPIDRIHFVEKVKVEGNHDYMNTKAYKAQAIIITSITLIITFFVVRWILGFLLTPLPDTNYNNMTQKEYNQFQEWDRKQQKNNEDSNPMFK